MESLQGFHLRPKAWTETCIVYIIKSIASATKQKLHWAFFFFFYIIVIFYKPQACSLWFAIKLILHTARGPVLRQAFQLVSTPLPAL